MRRAGLFGWLPALVPPNGGPNTLMDVIEDHLREHLRDGDGPGKPKAASEDDAQDERVDTAKKSPAHRFGNRSRVGVSRANEHWMPSRIGPRAWSQEAPALRAYEAAPCRLKWPRCPQGFTHELSRAREYVRLLWHIRCPLLMLVLACGRGGERHSSTPSTGEPRSGVTRRFGLDRSDRSELRPDDSRPAVAGRGRSQASRPGIDGRGHSL